MNELDGVPVPLRPLAAQVLAAIFPWFAPTTLKRAVNEAGERERRYLSRLTGEWTAQHWAALSTALSRPGQPVQVQNADEAFAHVAMQIVVEQTTFRFCWPKGAATPRVTAECRSPALSSADLAVEIKLITADINRLAARRQLREAVRKLFADEQQRSRDERDVQEANIEVWRLQFANIQQSVAACAKTSGLLADRRQKAERDRSDAIAAASDIASDGAAALTALSRSQDQRDVLLDGASSGQPSDLNRILELEQAIDRQIAEIGKLEAQADEQVKAIKSQDEAIDALNKEHSETAEAPFDAAVEEAKKMAGALQKRLIELTDAAAVGKERRRIAAAVSADDEPELVMAQLDALDLWQLGRAPDHARKRACSEAISTLETALNQARANWQRPNLEHGGKSS